MDIGEKVNNIKIGQNARKPEVHALATAEANIKLAKVYANLSNKDSSSLKYELKAIKHVGKALEATRNYQLNSPYMDSYVSAFHVLGPILKPIIEQFGTYKTKRGFARLLKDFKKYYSKHKYDTEITESSSIVDILDEGLNQNNLLEFFSKKTIDQTTQYIKDLNHDETIKKLRKYTNKLREDPSTEEKIIRNLDSFISGFASDIKGHDKYMENLSNAIDGVYELQFHNNLIFDEKVKQLFAWGLDIVANLGEELSETEFNAIKESAIEYIEELF